ncbi:hypothetical protein RHGRI_026971 [Rhododendron griersonianum]|uniref:Retrotransposon Copia-like N-terminal domain-containing protein n=1 Tax=Rhododendron griersonianum TaxID=479676 RepID=A0AAV6IX34_9ERIC|nr:hypothetical protein RHGRI_026971 [Rhododendron griersonianum]
MEKIDAAQPISITLDGSNYILWAQAMTSFLKGKKLWRIITGDVIKPVKAAEENQSKYEERLEDWDSKNHQVVTWIRNTSVTSISLQFGRFQNQNAPAKDIWDFLKGHYQSDCWKNPNKQSHGSNSRGQSRNTYSQLSQSKSNYQYKSNITSRPAAVVTEASDSTSPDSAPTPLTPQFSMTDVEAIIQQVLAKSGISHSTALSVTSGAGSSDRTDPWDRP